MNTWESYVEKLKQIPYELLRQKLGGDTGLARMLVLAKSDPTSKSLVGKLEKTQLEWWLDQGKSADYVFKLLRLDRERDKLFKSLAINTWDSYVTKLDRKKAYESMFSILRAHYSDETLAPMLMTAKKSGAYSTRDVAESLEKVQLKAWVKDGKSADDVFKFLRLDKDGDRLFENPNFNTWASFVRTLDNKNPHRTMLSVLKTRYTDESLATLFDAAKRVQLRDELWLSQGKTLDDAFSLLKLDQAGGNVFTSAGLGAWVSYATKLSKADDKLDEFAAIKMLDDRFGDFKLAIMFSAAKTKNKVESVGSGQAISQLQTLQFKQWLKRGETPGAISNKAAISGDKRALGVFLDYHDFYKAIRASEG